MPVVENDILAETITTDFSSPSKRVLAKEIEGKSLSELMEWARLQEEEAETNRKILDQVRLGFLRTLAPYLQPEPLVAPLDISSAAQVSRLMKERHLDPTQYGVTWPEAKTIDDRMVNSFQERVDRIFGPGRVQCILVRGKEGQSGIAAIGVSASEYNAASSIERHRVLAERRAEIAAEAVRSKIASATPDTHTRGIGSPRVRNFQPKSIG